MKLLDHICDFGSDLGRTSYDLRSQLASGLLSEYSKRNLVELREYILESGFINLREWIAQLL